MIADFSLTISIGPIYQLTGVITYVFVCDVASPISSIGDGWNTDILVVTETYRQSILITTIILGGNIHPLYNQSVHPKKAYFCKNDCGGIHMNYGYIRVSTDGQTVENQKLAIRNFCRYRRLRHVQWVAETISGTKKPEKRKLGSLLSTVQEGDTIIVTELSRLGRSLMMILDVLQELLEKKVSVIAIKEGYELGDNIQSKVLAFAFGLSAEIERTLLSERTKQGLERARKAGKQIGRIPGQKPLHYKLTPYRHKIKRWLKDGKSKLAIARECGVTWCTLNRFIREHLNDKPPKPLTSKPQKHGHPTILERQWFTKNS